MSSLETNIFPITNLRDLKARYELYRIRGLAIDQHEYDHNAQILIGRLSRVLKAPIAVVIRDGQPCLAVPEGTKEPESPFQLVRATAHFDATGQTVLLDYENPTPDTEQLCIRFLQFAIGGVLYRDPRFWQPSSGQPFFEREPVYQKDGINVYRGYAARVVRVDDGKFGVCVDVTYKYASCDSLPVRVSREEFREHKGSRCIYHFGLDWYEIRLHDHTGLNLKEVIIEDAHLEPVSLYDYIMQKARRPFPKDVANLALESAALRYLTARGDVRHAAAALCYPVYDTSDPRIQRIHRDTILEPTKRRAMIHAFVKSSLSEIRTEGMVVRVSPRPLSVPKNLIAPPDLAFGNGTILSVRGTPGAVGVSLNQLGTERLSALYNGKIGPYARKPLDLQYFIVPVSLWDSQGPAFLDELKKEVNAVYPQEIPYDPVVIPYNDRVAKTFTAQGKAVLQAIDAGHLKPGFGIVMIQETERRMRQHDQLASMLMHQLRKRDLFMTTIHTTMANQSYRLVQNGQRGPAYEPTRERRGRLHGYLRNVALNKVLLANERWPFVLATSLNADVTIAIDVQNHTACFTFVGKSGPDIRTEVTSSQQKEKLGKAHVRKVTVEVLRQDPVLPMRPIQNIVIQRDGLLFTDEMNGAKEAVEMLKKEGKLPSTAVLNFVEIHKKSVISFRLFDVDTRPGGWEVVQNPHVGSYVCLNGRDGYVCSTGREFSHPGTAKPLYVKYIEGTMAFKDILEDIYAQTCLALTRPEDCSRLPFTLKLTDIRLTEHAGIYDEDALAFGEDDQEDTEPRTENQEVEAHE
jgi:hypothetical protein